ncbi:MAG: S8 family serine peptidase, partial [candidate division Zixibacteria bacterium]|nr:S8 family serine peptidase [candidate division Zixibacteria bacterium]
EDINGNGVFDNYPENSGGDLNYFDDDENGFEDDVIGFDLAENDPNPREDAVRHGTPVAGIASMATDNDEGAAGVGFSARLMAVKVFDEDGNFTEAYNGIIYAADNGAHIINCSWGIPIFRQYEQDIINTVCETGALVVASGGDGQMGQPYYPCAYDIILVHTMVCSVSHPPMKTTLFSMAIQIRMQLTYGRRE